MPENDLEVKSISDFLALPEAVRWQVLFFGIIGVKKSNAKLEKLAWGILGTLIADGVLILAKFHI